MMTPVANVPGAVAVTPLVRQLLAGPSDRDEPSVEDAAAAAWYEASGAYAAAFKCLTASVRASDSPRSCDHGQAMIAAGQGADILEALETISSSSPEIGTDLGICGRSRCRRSAAPKRPSLGSSAGVPPSGSIHSAVAWRLGALHYLRGDTHAASAVLERAVLGVGEPSRRRRLPGLVGSDQLVTWRP